MSIRLKPVRAPAPYRNHQHWRQRWTALADGHDAREAEPHGKQLLPQPMAIQVLRATAELLMAI